MKREILHHHQILWQMCYKGMLYR